MIDFFSKDAETQIEAVFGDDNPGIGMVIDWCAYIQSDGESWTGLSLEPRPFYALPARSAGGA